MKTRLLALAVCLAVVTTASSAHAYHDESSPSPDGTPYTLGQDHWRVGLWKLDYAGPLDGKLQLGTYTVYWLPWLANVRLFNFNVKYNIWSNDRLSFAAGLAVFYLNLENLADTPVRFTIVPVDVYAAYRLRPSVTLVARGTLTSLSGDGAYDRDEIGAAQGAVAASSAQLGLSAIWRLNRVVALEGEWRFGRYLEIYGQGKATFALGDGLTEVDVFGEGSADVSDTTLSSIAARLHLSWRSINFRLGLVVGNYTIGGINFIIPVRLPIPELDLYVRF